MVRKTSDFQPSHPYCTPAPVSNLKPAKALRSCSRNCPGMVPRSRSSNCAPLGCLPRTQKAAPRSSHRDLDLRRKRDRTRPDNSGRAERPLGSIRNGPGKKSRQRAGNIWRWHSRWAWLICRRVCAKGKCYDSLPARWAGPGGAQAGVGAPAYNCAECFWQSPFCGGNGAGDQNRLRHHSYPR